MVLVTQYTSLHVVCKWCWVNNMSVGMDSRVECLAFPARPAAADDSDSPRSSQYQSRITIGGLAQTSVSCNWLVWIGSCSGTVWSSTRSWSRRTAVRPSCGRCRAAATSFKPPGKSTFDRFCFLLLSFASLFCVFGHPPQVCYLHGLNCIFIDEWHQQQ